MLLHFDAVVPSRPTTQVFGTTTQTTEVAQQVVTTAITETVTVSQMPSEARGYVGRDASTWSWSDLRDYVVHQIEQRFGTFPRDAKKEYGIFTRFAKEHGAQAGPIAQHAFEVADGWWSNAPISINRFCRASDPFFADVIKARLVQPSTVANQGW